jgi:anti-anti-sigma regulatory factor
MLRILRNDLEPHRVILVLQGRIVGEWAALLEHECVEVCRSSLRVSLDFAEVVFIDRFGFEALSRLTQAGVRIIGCTPLIADALEQKGIVASQALGAPEST